MDQIELLPGTNRDTTKSQFFTPPKLAAKVVEWAGIRHSLGGINLRDMIPMRVLEPSAGNGAIVRELVKAGAQVTACEIDQRYFEELSAFPIAIQWGDFLEADGYDLQPRFDLCVGNFPFHLDLTGAFTLHALKFCPRVCAIYPGNVFYSEQREELWKQVRPTRIAYMSKRAWPGATDYVALELVRRQLPALSGFNIRDDVVSVEWWHEAWD